MSTVELIKVFSGFQWLSIVFFYFKGGDCFQFSKKLLQTGRTLYSFVFRDTFEEPLQYSQVFLIHFLNYFNIHKYFS